MHHADKLSMPVDRVCTNIFSCQFINIQIACVYPLKYSGPAVTCEFLLKLFQRGVVLSTSWRRKFAMLFPSFTIFGNMLEPY